jgi:ribonuclease HI
MYSLQFDGLIRQVKGSTGKDSKAGFMCYGWLIFHNGKLVAKGHGVYARAKDATSNVSEYLVLIEGLEALRDMGVLLEYVVIQGDAKSVIDQMQGVASVNSPRMKPLHRRARKLTKGFTNLRWTWTPRKNNKDADLLTRHALRQIRSDKIKYTAAISTIDPDNPLKLKKKERSYLSLLDLRIFQPAGIPAN